MNFKPKNIFSPPKNIARFVKKRKEEIGLSPDDISFRGEKKMDEVVLRVIDFDSEILEETTVDSAKKVIVYREKPTVTWFNIDGLHDGQVIEDIADAFDFDKLILAEVMDVHSRSKVQEFSDCILL